MRMTDQLKTVLPVYIPKMSALMEHIDVSLAAMTPGQSGMEVSWALDHDVQELVSMSRRMRIYFVQEVGNHFINFLVGLRTVPAVAPGHLEHCQTYMALLRDYVAACATTLDFEDATFTRKFHVLMLREREEIARLSREKAAA